MQDIHHPIGKMFINAWILVIDQEIFINASIESQLGTMGI